MLENEWVIGSKGKVSILLKPSSQCYYQLGIYSAGIFYLQANLTAVCTGVYWEHHGAMPSILNEPHDYALVICPISHPAHIFSVCSYCLKSREQSGASEPAQCCQFGVPKSQSPN